MRRLSKYNPSNQQMLRDRLSQQDRSRKEIAGCKLCFVIPEGENPSHYGRREWLTPKDITFLKLKNATIIPARVLSVTVF